MNVINIKCKVVISYANETEHEWGRPANVSTASVLRLRNIITEVRLNLEADKEY